jgi:hypothetical protein
VGKKLACVELFRIKTMFYIKHLKFLYSHEWWVGETKLKKNKQVQKYLGCDEGKQLVMP